MRRPDAKTSAEPRRTIRSRTTLRALSAALAGALLLLPLAGCMGDPRSETIVIPGTEDEGPAGEAGSGTPFQVKTIYPLPVAEKYKLPVLGWAAGDALVGYFAAGDAPEASSTFGLQRLDPPYERPKPLAGAMNLDTEYGALSPDGKTIAGFAKAANGIGLALFPLDGGQVEQVSEAARKQRPLYSRTLQWSGNGRYLSYLAYGEARGELRVAVYDEKSGKLGQLPLAGLQDSGSEATVVLTDDGSGALIEDGKTIAMAKREGGGFKVRYDHPSGIGPGVWVDNERFAFLGADGTLFQYDGRSGELSVLLEKVAYFSLSPDRKAIAYTRNDPDDVSVYAGKLQGNNVLSQSAVFQGVIPFQMAWSPSGSALLIDGGKPYASTAQETAPSAVAGDGRRQTFVIRFR
ncbi:hypothetical protein SAMN02799624_00053 [Paenibacillus sp. UNC496MF]|uniref:TolB family protein n=1 Tax=Paenibacillus sp. UNC496MF TaxID=1502753 RepID=UPI0008EE698F|nr:hypothetical protein [Paenibacillus sp. UNC496MF]SFI27602.1 hypothetical protein SAMN02799624_00053 [Paenibacillus sp. UNC496MF]